MRSIEFSQSHSGIDYTHYPHLHIEDSPRKIAEIKSVLPSDFRSKSLLDVGCDAALITRSIGELTGATNVQVVEPSSDAIPHALDNLRNFPESKIHQVDFVDYIPDRIPDLTMFIDVLEHLEDPASVLKKAAAFTRFAIVRTPLEDSIAAQIHKQLYGGDIKALMEQRYGHVHHYTQAGLRQLIEDNGFEVVTDTVTRIPKEATILDRKLSKFLESISWAVLKSKYPKLWGGFYLAFLRSKDRKVLDQDDYNSIKHAIDDVIGEGNILSIMVFGSTTNDRDKMNSDYDFTIVADGLPDEIEEREKASPRIKKILQEMGINQLCAFNLYTPEEFEAAANNKSWLIQTMRSDYRILHDKNGFIRRIIEATDSEIIQTGEFSWKGVSYEGNAHLGEVIERYKLLSIIIEPISIEVSEYYRREALRGELIRQLFEHGEYDTRGSLFSLAKKLHFKYGVKLEMMEIQVQDFLHETEGRKAMLDYENTELHLKIADELTKNGLHLDALAHTYYALRNIYLKHLHANDGYIIDGEVTQLFLKGLSRSLPQELVDLIYTNSFKAEQILGRSGFVSFDLDKNGNPVYENANNSVNNYSDLQQNIRKIISELELGLNINGNKDDPKISIVIATYNRPDMILNCIRSLNNLLIPDGKIEIVIVNDGSSVEYDLDAIQRTSRFPINYVVKDHSGICATKNKGIENSKGEFIAFLDDDMIPSPLWIVQLMSGFKNDQIAGVGSTNLTYPEDNQYTQYIDYRELARKAFRDKSGEILNVLTGSACIRKDVLVSVGGFNTRQSELGVNFGGDDVDLTWRIRNAGYSLGHVNEAICFHNHRGDFNSLVKQHVGYGEGTMFHCLDAGRTPESLGIPNPDYSSVIRDLLRYSYIEVPKRIIECYRDRLGLKKSIQYPLLDLVRKFSYDMGILKSKRFQKQLKNSNI